LLNLQYNLTSQQLVGINPIILLRNEYIPNKLVIF
jgi:hypothetical protein